jgi:hypothetical protein
LVTSVIFIEAGTLRATIPKVKMKRDLTRKAENKRAFRRQLAARPLAEKLRMLDALRERTLAIRRASKSGTLKEVVVQETPPHL